MAVSQNLNSVAERVFYTREARDDIELEQFNCDNRRIHPMQFLSRVREMCIRDRYTIRTQQQNVLRTVWIGIQQNMADKKTFKIYMDDHKDYIMDGYNYEKY